MKAEILLKLEDGTVISFGKKNIVPSTCGKPYKINTKAIEQAKKSNKENN